jgi:hypothetical protein
VCIVAKESSARAFCGAMAPAFGDDAGATPSATRREGAARYDHL